MMTDPIADVLARIRNAVMVKKSEVILLRSKIGKEIARIMQQEGYVGGHSEQESPDGFGRLIVSLKYDEKGDPILDGLSRVSRPGLRVYRGATEMPKVRGGLGIAIISTSKGLMTCEEARKQKVGGEVLCKVW